MDKKLLEEMGYEVEENYTLSIKADFCISSYILNKLESEGWNLIGILKDGDKIKANFEHDIMNEVLDI
jgi:hypothetical protein